MSCITIEDCERIEFNGMVLVDSIRNILIELGRELKLIYPCFEKDIEQSRKSNIEFGKDLSRIQDEFQSIKAMSPEDLSLYTYTEQEIMRYLECYWDFDKDLRRGCIPGYLYIPQDIEVKFDTEIYEDNVITRHGGHAYVTGSHGYMPAVLEHLFMTRTENNVSSIKAGTYIRSHHDSASVFWNSANGFFDLIE